MSVATTGKNSKKTVTMRLDADLLDWFRRNSGYQTRIGEVRRGRIQVKQKAVPSPGDSGF